MTPPPAEKPTASGSAEADPGVPGDPQTLEAECEIEFLRASGPGGQHRNKVESGVRLRHLPTGLVVTATERRSQSQNRAAAIERLRERLVERARPRKKRRPTRKSRAVRTAEIQAKRRRGETKRERRAIEDER